MGARNQVGIGLLYRPAASYSIPDSVPGIASSPYSGTLESICWRNYSELMKERVTKNYIEICITFTPPPQKKKKLRIVFYNVFIKNAEVYSCNNTKINGYPINLYLSQYLPVYTKFLEQKVGTVYIRQLS
jgi:hypothetical protein